MFDRHLFTAAVQAHLLEKGFSVREASHATGVSASTISRMANGDFLPNMETFAALACWLELDTTSFSIHPIQPR